ncbi:MAG: TetR/AcrR family transcriptional regulator [Spirochaetales bacterium]|nr:TetR/AcrR family transcriptional regulator [Spirochaetales bacterium]
MNNKEIILSTAIKLFGERGYEAVSVREIVQACEVSKPTLYHYFGSKIGLIHSVAEFYLTPFNSQLSVAGVYSGDIYLSLKKVMNCYFNFIENHQDFYRLYLTLFFAPAENEAGSIIRGEIAKQHEIIENLFENACVNHGNMRGREKRYASTFIGLINSYAGFHLGQEKMPDENEQHLLLHQFMHGIFS